MEILEIRDESELQEAVERVLDCARKKKEPDEASVVALYGDLGAGKTAFTKALARTLGVAEDVTSPTFVILKRYETGENAPFAELVHIDAYRIENIDEMRVLRFEEFLHQKDTIICIEWADLIETLLPQNAVRVHIAIAGDMRRITIE